MKEVRIYLYSTVKETRERSGAYTYILETETNKGPATISKTEKVEKMTNHKCVLAALAAALRRISQNSYLIIYTDSSFVAVNTKDSLSRWNRNGWKTARGETVKHVEEWKEIDRLIKPHSFEFVVNLKHSYYQWMKTESEKAVECI